MEKLYLGKSKYEDMDNDFESLKSEVFRITGFLEREIGLGKNEIELYFSGAKGFHIVVPPDVLGIEPSTNLNEIYKSWANYLFNTYDIGISIGGSPRRATHISIRHSTLDGSCGGYSI